MATSALTLVPDAEPFPGYRLCHVLGQGSFGEVWKAVRPDGRAVAVKFMNQTNGRILSREIRIIQSISHIKHRNLIQVHRVWADSAYVVIEMELAEGSLLDLMDVYYNETGGPLPQQHVCFFLSQAARVIDFLNSRRHRVNGRRVAVRHCDVKPSNFLVFNDIVKITDFSLSFQTASSMWHCERVGTPDYTAPEMFQGWLSEHSDQFSLAITYCYLRTGALPFPRVKDLSKGRTTETPELTDLESRERNIIARALRPIPQDRWPSCTDMMQRLDAVCPAQG